MCVRIVLIALPVPAGVGGRFSVLTPVGLFPAAAAGIDVEELLAGAAHMDERSKAASSDTKPSLFVRHEYVFFSSDDRCCCPSFRNHGHALHFATTAEGYHPQRHDAGSAFSGHN